MNEVTEELLGKFNPVLSIVVYNNENDYYLESHEIDSNGRLCAGKPLEEKTLGKIASYFQKEEQKAAYSDGIFPSNILYLDDRTSKSLIWYRKPESRQMYFNRELKIKDGVAKVPGLIYKTTGDTLDIFAYKEFDAETKDTVLYQAPFHNTGNAGRVCLGSSSVRMPHKPSLQQIMKYWEDKFWLSVFTHITGSNPAKSNINFLWSEQIKKKQDFPTDELLETKLTLKSLLK